MGVRAKRWNLWPACPADHFARFPHLHRLLVQILYNRGVTAPDDVEAFLTGRLRFDNPFKMRGIAEAVTRLRRAIDRQETIAVYGDFDADGVTATVLLVETLDALGGKVRAYIPNRVDEGYGLNCEALERLHASGATLVVTVDCGVRSLDEVAFANRLGMDVIVTDHHNVGRRLPAARAVINPRQDGCGYPFKDLAGVGVAFRLAQALLRARQNYDHAPVDLAEGDLYDLVALGTVADVVPLLGENRDLVQRGLASLRHPRRPGLVAMLEASKLQAGRVDATSIGFVLGPRLNAAGRLATADISYELLTNRDQARAAALAQQLELLNRQRQDETLALVNLVKEKIAQLGSERHLYLAADKGYHRGIVGLAAGRVAEELYRPVAVAEIAGDRVIGSARSIPEFDITAALDACKAADDGMLIRYGGHAMAAGFTAPVDRLPELADRLEALASDALGGKELAPALDIDAEVGLDELDYATQELLAQLEPCGRANPQPLLASRGLEVCECRLVGRDEQHLKLAVRDPRATGARRGQVWPAIAFRQGEWYGQLQGPGRVDLAFALEVDEFNGERRLQLNVKDIRLWSDAPSGG
jgi:single-stranded-DNA-specific exonuclease